MAWRRDDEERGHILARVGRRDSGWPFHGTEVLAGPAPLPRCPFRTEVDTAWADPGGRRGLAARRWRPPLVDVPALGVSRVDQTDRRLSPLRWQHSNPAHGAFELTVDDGLVVDHTGFATRVAG